MNSSASSPFFPLGFDSPDIDKCLEEMSILQKVGQLFMAFVWGESLDEEAKSFLSQTKVGNVAYFTWANSLVSAEQVGKLSEEINTWISQNTGFLPLIAADQEGGFVIRLQKEFTHFPSPMSVAATGDPSLARKMGKAIGDELLKVGVNFNLAPVVDVFSDPLNPTINVRSFGSSARHVTTFAEAMIEGMEESGILYSLKHAPGYGNATKDAHEELPTSNKPYSQLEETDFYPFMHLGKKAPAVMTAHLIFSDLDPKNIATFSKNVLQNLIRKKWSYEGLIISDSLSMNAALEKKGSLKDVKESMLQAAIKAFDAGCDMLIVLSAEWSSFKPTKKQDYEIISYVITSFVERVRSGAISKERLDVSVRRILTLKKKLTPFAFQGSPPIHKELALEIAQKSLTPLSSNSLFGSIEYKNPLFIFPKEQEKTFCQMVPKENCYFFPTDPDCLIFSDLSNWLCSHYKEGDLVIFFSCHAHTFPKQKELLKNICEAFPSMKIAIVGLCNPYDVMDTKMNAKYPTYLTYSADPYSLQNVLYSMENHIIPTGNLPVTIR